MNINWDYPGSVIVVPAKSDFESCGNGQIFCESFSFVEIQYGRQRWLGHIQAALEFHIHGSDEFMEMMKWLRIQHSSDKCNLRELASIVRLSDRTTFSCYFQGHLLCLLVITQVPLLETIHTVALLPCHLRLRWRLRRVLVACPRPLDTR